MISNPRWNSFSSEPLDGRKLSLPPNFLHVSLQTSYRSTISITLLARYISKCLHKTLPDFEPEVGTDLVGATPTFFDTGSERVTAKGMKLRLRFALEAAEKQLGSEVTVLYNISLQPELADIVESMWQKKGGPWQCYQAVQFYGWEADKVFSA